MFLSATHPSLLNMWRKKSLAASLMAFSGVTRVRFTAAPATTNLLVTNFLLMKQRCRLAETY